METMQWSEISAAASSQVSAVNAMGGNDQHGSDNGLGGTLGAPTIKNHSVTYFNDHLYCFGGYDGRRNHNLLLLYNIKEHRWIRPQTRPQTIPESIETNVSVARVNIEGNESPSSNSNNNISNNNNNNERHRDVKFAADDTDDSNANETGDENAETNSGEEETENAVANDDSNNDSASEQANESQEAQNRQARVGFENNHFNRDIPPLNDRDGFYPGLGDRRNSNNTSSYEYTVTGNPPPGRNGHSATLATDEDENNNDEDVTGRIIVLGGWLGQGPLAASDMHVLEISRGGRTLRWYQPAVKGTPPGPCNMHSADYVKARKEVFVFRGGNGKFQNSLACVLFVNVCSILVSDSKPFVATLIRP